MKKVILFIIFWGIFFSEYAQSLNIDVSRYPFSYRGSYLAVFKLTDHTDWGIEDPKEGLFIRNVSRRTLYDYMIRMDIIENDSVVKPDIITTPDKMTLTTSGGRVEICFETPTILRIRTHRLKVKLLPTKSSFILKNGEKHLRLLNGPANDFYYMFSSLAGTMRYKGVHFAGKEKTHPNLYEELSVMLEPNTSGDGEFALEEFKSEWVPKEYDKPFDLCVSDRKQEFTDWENRFSLNGAAPIQTVKLAAYVSWSCLVRPEGEMKREGMYMSKNWMNMIWSWDHCFNAMAMSSVDSEVSWNQMMCIFDHQNDLGALPDGFDDQKEYWGIVKTPIHGWALQYLMKSCDWLSTDHLSQIYEPLCRWTDFWFKYRDYDGDGIPQYNHSYESFDDTTPLDAGFPLEAPELCTFLILQMDALSDVAHILGKADTAEIWKKRSEILVDKMLTKLWNGKRFVAKCLDTGEWNQGTIDFLQYVPFLLGERLPSEVRRKMVSSFKASGLITSFGIATESPQSPFFDPDSYTRGSIWAPVNIFIIDGLMKSREAELAEQLAEVYCKHMIKNGFPERFDAHDGGIRSDPEYTWTSSVFLLLHNIK